MQKFDNVEQWGVVAVIVFFAIMFLVGRGQGAPSTYQYTPDNQLDQEYLGN